MDHFIGTILPWPINWAPQGFVLCQGQSIPVMQNQALYSLIGNTYGGNTTSFNVPDLRGRFPLGAGTNPVNGGVYNVGNRADVKQVTLIANNLPGHTHPITNTATGGDAAVNFDVKIPVNTDAYNATTAASIPGSTCTLAAGKAGVSPTNIYTTNPPTTGANLKPFNVQTTISVPAPTVTSTCGVNVVPNPLTPVSIMPPYLCLNYIMCTQGIYPMRE